jgi:catechol 2,3-dioxygenase-like lactoylglutathione lyase family enzyme
MIRGINHISISTNNLAAMLHFYRDLLGFRQVMQHEVKGDNALFDAVVGLDSSVASHVALDAGNVLIEFWAYQHPRGRDPVAGRPVCDAGLTHLCLEVADVQAEYQRLVAAGVRFQTPPITMTTVCTTYARDPDDNIVELQEIINKSSAMALPDRALAACRPLNN